MLNRLCLATVVLLALAMPLHAQTTQTPIEIEATIGLDGWIDESRPVPVEVTIRSEVLFAGTLELKSGAAIVTVAVEVLAEARRPTRSWSRQRLPMPSSLSVWCRPG